MKRSMVTVVVLLAAMVLGCDNGPLHPMGPAGSDAGLSKSAPEVKQVSLGGTAREPYPNSVLVFDVEGVAGCVLTRLSGNENLFRLDLTVDAILTPRLRDPEPMSISGSSSHLVSVSEESVAFQEVRYLLPGRDDRVALMIMLQVTTDNVEVADMWLDFIE